MKVAIMGGGPAGLLAAWEFYQLGAEVVLFGGDTLGGGIRRMAQLEPAFSMGFSAKELLPASLVGEGMEGHIPTVGEYWREHLEPLGKNLRSTISIKKVRVSRVHKSFLGEGEVIQGRSRLADLFRVVWCRDDLEFYEDFDIVIEAGGVFRWPLPAGPGSSPALNEEKCEGAGHVSKSWDIFDHLTRLSGKERVLLVGSGAMGALFCRQFFSRFPDGMLDLVTVEREPFEQLEREGRYPWLWEQVQSLLEGSYRDWKRDGRGFPPSFCLYNGYNVVAIDKLEDRQNLFVTIEAPPFRREKGGIKTLSVEGVVVATGYRREVDPSVPSEPGLYRLEGDIPGILTQIQAAVEEVLTFFSPRL